jgi:NADH-quinone oxidoreductase subunit J
LANLLFYLLSAGAVLSAIGVIASRNPVMSVTSLLASFFCVASIYLLAGFQFLAAVQILVYAGAIMVLFLFVVMLLNLGDPGVAIHEPLFHGGKRAMAGVGIAIALAAGGLVAILRESLAEASVLAGVPPIQIPEGGFDPIDGVAARMFTRYSLPFEAASVLLLATAVGVLVIAKRQRPGLASSDAPTDSADAAGSARARVAAKDEAGQ